MNLTVKMRHGQGPLQFPRIQGGDICGRIVQVGEGVEPKCIDSRVIVRSMQNSPNSKNPFAMQTVGSEIDGGLLSIVLH